MFTVPQTSTLSNNIPLSDKTNTSSTNSERTTFTTVRGVLSEKMKDICGKVLMIDSPLLSRTLLNRSISGHNMTDIHKACEVLIKMKLLSLKTNFLANKHSYQPCYLKLLPNTVVEEINFSMMLKDVGIKDIQMYFNTMKKIKTKNLAFVTQDALALFNSPPYCEHVLKIDERLVMKPTGRKVWDFDISERNVDVVKSTANNANIRMHS
ncbi:unnamed protein product [Didymodactylos carnosus]|uniref:Uncharacterized protein n=1 Tax=Didymodactylos carnosus TaxID=1234261 RepID=A0A8S2XYX1_9BILA|nr:unnamed protein product [Didymodactylos carnosus]